MRRVVVTFAVVLEVKQPRGAQFSLARSDTAETHSAFKGLRHTTYKPVWASDKARRAAAASESKSAAERLLVEPAATRDRETPSQRRYEHR